MCTQIPGSPGGRTLFLAGNFLFSCLLTASGQLAITEVMSSASTSLGATTVTAGPDFWELTNFGTDPVNLANYTFADDKDVRQVLVSASDPDPLIQPGESLLFVRSNPTDPIPVTEDQFRAWWGSCLSPNARVRLYPNPGLNGTIGDRVSVYDAGGSLVGRVDFGLARNGVTFVYDTNS